MGTIGGLGTIGEQNSPSPSEQSSSQKEKDASKTNFTEGVEIEGEGKGGLIQFALIAEHARDTISDSIKNFSFSGVAAPVNVQAGDILQVGRPIASIVFQNDYYYRLVTNVKDGKIYIDDEELFSPDDIDVPINV